MSSHAVLDGTLLQENEVDPILVSWIVSQLNAGTSEAEIQIRAALRFGRMSEVIRTQTWSQARTRVRLLPKQ